MLRLIRVGRARTHAELVADEHLLAGVREVVYRRSTALATRNIRIARSTLDDRAGIIGAAVMVIEAVLAPDAVDQAIAAVSA
jgi:hypothetical protein